MSRFIYLSSVLSGLANGVPRPQTQEPSLPTLFSLRVNA